VVIASSTHPFDVRASWRLARKFGALFVMEIHDLWPLTPQLLGGYKPSHPLIRFMQREADFGYQNADLIVSILPGTADYLQSRGMPEGNWTCIPNGWSPSQHAVPVSAATASAMRDLRLAFPFVIAYAGGFGLSNVLDELLDSASDLAAAGIAVALAGDGPRSGELRHRYGDEANIEFVGRLESAQVPNFLELADAGYLGVPDSPLYRHGISPNKIFDYMGAAKPILFVGEAFGNPVEAADCGVVVRSRQQLVEGAKRLARMSPSERASLGGSGHSYLKRNHSRALLSDRFLEALHATRERRPAAAR